MLCSLVKNAEHGAIQDEAERMYVLEETVLSAWLNHSTSCGSFAT